MNHMEISKNGFQKRKKDALEFWLRVATDYNAGMTPTEIAKRYRNPKTHKRYSRGHIQWILKKLRTIPASELDKYTKEAK